jgi:hypothetical protein
MMSANDQNSDQTAPGRALVLVGVSHPRREASLPRRAAPFLAQLIATRAQAPQTRLNRRAEPAEATARYRATAQMLK